jgi:hypothetical protein
LDDTSNCPKLPKCEGCGSDDDVAVATVDYGFGVMCVTLCEPCTDDLPRFNVMTAAKRGIMHCEHLGIDLDEMARLRHEELGTESDFRI